MTDELAVLLSGVHAAAVRRRDGRLSLAYLSSYRRRGATPLSLSMSLSRADHGHEVVSSFLANLLPDNPAVLDRWAARFHVSAGSPFSLLRHVGGECAGAVQLVPPEQLQAQLSRQGTVTWLSVDGVAARLRELREDRAAWQGTADPGWFSLAGAQAKTALQRGPDGRWGAAAGSQPTTHILKPAISGLVDHDLNEHLCLSAARILGFAVAPSSVLTFGTERALVIERYDRLRTPQGAVLRVHQEDLCQALGLPPGRRYQRDHGPTPAQIGELLRREARPQAKGIEAVERFADAMALNWLLGAADAHTKNYSVLLSGSQVRLAPLYDVASVLPYADIDSYKAKLAMKVSTRYVMRDILGRHWASLAVDLGIDPAAFLARIETMAMRLPDALQEAADDPAITSLGSELPARLVSTVAEHAARCRRQLVLR